MNNDTIAERKKKISKRKRIYFFLGWPLIAIGMGLFFYKPAFTLSLVFIISGVVIRLLYYYTTVELKSLDRYEKLLDKSKMLILLGFVLFSISSSLCAQLKEGDDALELTGLEWMVGAPVKILDEKENERIYVIEFWASWDNGSLLSFPLLNKIQQEYGQGEICVIAITKEKKERLDKYVESIGKKNDFRIALDEKGSITKSYMGEGSGIPRVFLISKDKEVLWTGTPVNLQSVIKKVMKGSFDADLQKEINALQVNLQNKMQMDKTLEAVKTADRILELDPSNEVALRVRLFLFERTGTLNEAVGFIQNQIERNPDEAQLYFIKLDILERTGSPLDDRKNTCEEIYDRFKSDHEILERLAWTAVSRMRFGTAPLSIALKASEKAVSLLIDTKKQNPAKLANYLETQAKLYYSIGKISKAIEEQEKVIRLRKGDPSESETIAILDYYKEVLDLSGK